VVTPLSPTDWQLVFDGKAISLYPSVGSWNLPCQSHYWIRRDMVEWAPRWSRQRIEAERSRDRVAKADYYGGPGYPGRAEDTVNAKPSLWDKLMRGKKKGRS
jgi:hypothetical protein